MPKTYSRSAVHLSYLQNSKLFDCNFTEIAPTGREFYKDIIKFRKYIKNQKGPRLVIIMSPSHKIVPFLQFLPRTKLVFDAGWSLTESSLQRKNIPLRAKTIIKNFILDFMAFHLSELILLETDNQKKYVRKQFIVKKSKMIHLCTGFDETQVSRKPNHFYRTKWEQLKEQNKFSKIIVFRGKYNEESGLENLARITSILAKEHFLFVVITDRVPKQIIFSKKTIVIQEYVEWDELREIYKICDFFVGQLSFNRRLANTIPHKAFEAGFFGLPYITARNSGIEEIYNDSQVIYLNVNISTEFAHRVRTLTQDKTDLYRKAISLKYQNDLSQKVIGEQILLILKLLNRP